MAGLGAFFAGLGYGGATTGGAAAGGAAGGAAAGGAAAGAAGAATAGGIGVSGALTAAEIEALAAASFTSVSETIGAAGAAGGAGGAVAGLKEFGKDVAQGAAIGGATSLLAPRASIPKAQAPPTLDDARRQQEARDRLNRKKGGAASILTGKLGDSTAPTTATKTLLGQ